MTTNYPIRTASVLIAILMAANCLSVAAKEIPAQLPRPDGKPGDATKPVKVYILAGQSNMVGMGDITGASPPYAREYLSADPAIIPGVTPVGSVDGGKAHDWVAVVRHGVFEAKAAVYPGPNDHDKPPLKTVAVALGSVAAKLPATEAAQIVAVTALVDVPVTGSYRVHAGFGESSHNVVLLDGKEVYRKEVGGKPVLAIITLEQGKRYPLRITYFKGSSAAFWLERVEIPGKGDLETVVKKDKKFQYLIDDAGKWTVRGDVYYQEARLAEGGRGCPLSATANNGKSIGPELGFGYVMGTFHDEQVLLIKTAQGNRSLGFDFRPPSSGRTQPDNNFEGLEYRLMIKGVRETLDKIAKIVPGYQGQGYEIAGFGWFQGHKDSGATKEEYEKHLVNLINDLRKEFNAPKMPAVVATVGFHGYRLDQGPWKGVWAAQMAVGDPKQHPEFAGTVASADTRDYWREVEESPRGQDYHYNRNAETYLLVGEAMGRAMVRLQGGKAEAIAKSDREARVAAEEAAAAAKPAPTDEQKAASLAAIKPMILDGALAAFQDNPRYQPLLQAEVSGKRPAAAAPMLADTLDQLAEYYRTAGIHDYEWKPFGGDMKNATWNYSGFDLPKVQKAAPSGSKKKSKAGPVARVTYPAGMESWFAVDFDAKKAGWKSGAAPLGESAEKVVLPDWAKQRIAARVPKTLCTNDVFLLRQTFEIPPLKEGCRYRIRVAGSPHNNMGEGYAIYVNGKLLAEAKAGIVAWRKQGRLPRGGHVYSDFRDEFKGGKVTIAVASFPMDDRPPDSFIPPGAPLSVWMEEMKIPPLPVK